VKIRVIEPWERFWKKTFAFIKDNEFDPYDILFYITIVPSIYSTNHKKLQKFLAKIADMYNVQDKSTHKTAILYLLLMYNRFADYNTLPLKFKDGLVYMYRLAMNDYKKSAGCTFDEAYEHDDDITGSKIGRRSWYIINCILHNRAEEAKRIIQKTIKEEHEQYSGADEQGQDANEEALDIVKIYKRSKNRKYFDDVIKEYMPKYEYDDESAAHLLGGNIEDDKFIADKDMAKFFLASALYLGHGRKQVEILKGEAQKLLGMYARLKKQYKGDMDMAFQEREELLAQLRDNVQKEVIYLDNADKYEAYISSLKKEYERNMQKLKEEAEEWKDIAKNALNATKQQEATYKLPQLTEVAYFGLPDP
jgi:hypothetical protein